MVTCSYTETGSHNSGIYSGVNNYHLLDIFSFIEKCFFFLPSLKSRDLGLSFLFQGNICIPGLQRLRLSACQLHQPREGTVHTNPSL